MPRKRKRHTSEFVISTTEVPPPPTHRLRANSSVSKTDRSNIFPFFSLPKEVIDLILLYLFPHSEYSKRYDTLSRNVLPLALTCTSMYSLMMNRITTILINDLQTGIGRYPIIPDGSYGICNPLQRDLLFKASLIALNRMKQQLITVSNETQSVHPVTTRSHAKVAQEQRKLDSSPIVFNLNRITNERFDRFKPCSITDPLFSDKGHDYCCRHRLAWLSICANTGMLHSMNFDAFFHIHGWNTQAALHTYCIVRLLVVLRLRLTSIKMRNNIDQCGEGMESLLQRLLENSQDTLVELNVGLTERFRRVLCEVQLPNLKKLSLRDIVYETGKNPEDTMEILRQLKRNGTKLTTLSITQPLILDYDGSEVPEERRREIATLLPDLRYLTFRGPPRDLDMRKEGGVPCFGMVETLELVGFEVSLNKLNDMIQDYFPNLKRLLLTGVDLREFNDRIMPSARVIKELNYVDMITDLKTDFEDRSVEVSIAQLGVLIGQSFSNLCLSLSTYAFDGFCSFLESTKCLNGLRVSFSPSVRVRSGRSYAPHRLVARLLSKCYEMESLSITGSCITSEDCVVMLRRMKGKIKKFYFALTNEYGTFWDVEPRRLPSVEKIVAILDTLVEYCPQIEEFCVIGKNNVCEWTRVDEEVIKDHVLNCALKLKNYRVESFFKFWPVKKISPNVGGE